jgi:hypothetical protein
MRGRSRRKRHRENKYYENRGILATRVVLKGGQPFSRTKKMGLDLNAPHSFTEMQTERRLHAPLWRRCSQTLLGTRATERISTGLAARQELAIRFRLAIVLLMRQLRRGLLIQQQCDILMELQN